MTAASVDAGGKDLAARKYERKVRRWARPGLLAAELDPAVRDSAPLRLVDRELAGLADRTVPGDALAIFMPVQEGKSQRVSRWFPLWLLAHNPALRIAEVSYEQEMSVRWGRQVKRDIAHAPDDLGVSIMPDSAAAGRWDTPEGGGLYCVGVGGALTGRPVDVLIIDDPVKDREQAESVVYRERCWTWWESVALTRLAPGGITVLICARWHTDDLAGRILSRPGPLRWRVLSMPAIAGDRDVLGRQPGEEFPSARARQPGYFANLQATISPYVFAGLYQQQPVAAAGNFFRRQAFRYWRPADGVDPWHALHRRTITAGAWIDLEGLPVDLADCWRFATCDLAASTSTSADWTVIAVWAIAKDGSLILLDRRRARVEMSDHFTMARPLREKWRFDTLFVPKEFWGKTLVEDARQAGVPVAEVATDKDKVTRAIPAAARLHAGKVWWPHPGQAPWVTDEWEPELLGFDRAEHDDQVDTFSAAARVASAHWLPPPPPRSRRQPVVSPDMAEINRAYAAATGGGNGNGHLVVPDE